MVVKFQIRRDTSSNWALNNPVVSSGEMGYETDTGKLKIGDGSKTWSELNYFASNATRMILLSGAGGWASATSGSGSEQFELPMNRENYYGIKYTASDVVNTYHEWTFVMPNSYDGTALTYAVYWTVASTTPSGDVEFMLQGRTFDDGESLDQTWGDATTISDTVIGQYMTHITPMSSPLVFAGDPDGGKLIQVRLSRNVEGEVDTSSADVYVLGVLMLYTTDSYSD